MKLLSKIDAYIEDQDYVKELTKVRQSHHPSEVSSCNRAIYYKWKNAPVTNPRNAESIWRMEMGKAVELLAIKYMKDMGYDVEDQREINLKFDTLKYPIHGYIDIYALKEDMDKPVYAEVKTTWGQGTKDVQMNGPREQDVNQAMVYMYAENVQKYNMIYIARDTLWRSEYILDLSLHQLDVFMDWVVRKFQKIENYVESGTLPPRDFKAVVADGEVKKVIQRNGVKYSSQWQCMYCVRRDFCYADERADYGLHIPEGL